jgi:hypothetical protein
MKPYESKRKNPDKYIEQLKAEIARLQRVRSNLSKQNAEEYGVVKVNAHQLPDKQDSIIIHVHAPDIDGWLKQKTPFLRQSVAIEGEIIALNKNNEHWDTLTLEIGAVRFRDKKSPWGK